LLGPFFEKCLVAGMCVVSLNRLVVETASWRRPLFGVSAVLLRRLLNGVSYCSGSLQRLLCTGICTYHISIC
jgi:hypothetical protein